MSNIIKFPLADAREWKEISAGLRSGFAAGGVDQPTIERILARIKPTWDRLDLHFKGDSDDAWAYRKEVFYELTWLVVLIETGGVK